MTFYEDVQNCFEMWKEPTDVKDIKEKLDILFNVFYTVSGWPQDKVKFVELEMENGVNAKPSQAVVSQGKWFGMIARFNCGVAGVPSIDEKILMRGNRQGDYQVVLGDTFHKLKGEGDLTAIIGVIKERVKQQFMKLDTVRRDFGSA